MLTIDDVRARILAAFPGAQVEVADPRGTSNYFEAVIVSDAFEGMPRVKRQRTVMALFDAELKAGTVHALTFRTFTPDQIAT
jgi:acid stress-induced BolA-like protein IbaG/YrbA